MSPTNRLARRRPLPLPQIFGNRFPDVAQLIDNTFSLLPEFPEFTEAALMNALPAVNITEDSKMFTVTAELPGLAPEDVRLDFTDGVLTIQGDKTEEHTEKEDGMRYHVWERRSGTFQRSFPFPGGIADDKISANFKNGVLTIHMPKAAEEHAKRRSIKIEAK